TGETVTTVPLGGAPFAVAISPAGAVYVSQSLAGSLARGNLPRTDLPVHVPVGPLPSQVRVRASGQTAYVSNQDAGTITVVRVATNQVVGTIALTPSILTIGLSPDGRRLYALRSEERRVGKECRHRGSRDGDTSEWRVLGR